MQKKLGLKSIRTKLVASLIAICLIPIVTMGIITYSKSKSILRKKLELSSSQTITEVNRGLDNYFGAMSNQIKMLSGNVNFTDIDEHSNYISFTRLLLKDVQRSDSQILSAYFGTESGKFAIYPNSNMGKNYNPRLRPWYKLAMEKRGQVVITPPFKDVVTGKAVVSIAKTIEKNNRVIGVVAMNVTLETLSESLSQIKIGNSGYVFVSDDSGIIIAHPNRSLIGTYTGAKLSFWNDAQKNDNGFTEYKYEGQNKFASYDTNKRTGWKIVATMNENELAQDTNSIKYLVIIVLLIVAAIAVVVSFLISKGIGTNIKKLSVAFSEASNGDLTTTVDVKSKDEFQELGKDFNSMMDNISTLMRNVESSAKTVAETSTSLAGMAEETTESVGEVSRAIEEISIGATQQAQDSQGSVESMENLSGELDRITNFTKNISEITLETQKLSSRGLDKVTLLTDKSNQTRSASIRVNEIVQDVNNSVEQITTISDTIAEITAQTNLLSLNASIEAARAGEAGRGFAVVADEIRKLAEESRNSTEEIKSIIENIKVKSITAVEAMEETGNIVKEQDAAVNDTQKIFNEISSSISNLINRVNEIKDSVYGMQNKKDGVLKQMENISSISEETASATEQVSASTQQINATMDEFTKYAEELQGLSEKLSGEISKFKLS